MSSHFDILKSSFSFLPIYLFNRYTFFERYMLLIETKLFQNFMTEIYSQVNHLVLDMEKFLIIGFHFSDQTNSTIAAALKAEIHDN